MNFAKVFLEMLVLVIIVLLVYNVLKAYVLDKIKINKWVVLSIAIIVFIVPSIFWANKVPNRFLQYAQSAVFIVLFMWFMDLMGWGKRRRLSNDKNEVIKAKAKPNRIKNNTDMEILEEKKKKKRK
ncbi:hypothetical protein OW763_08175 [Clostridium aestuarii]|uniref:Uncharacterized protein n=1 Tax=Clostridium aestuarii TaxID=338193 RepID=A0ABT4CZS1_9CLOT|nr:hypothetical protein [Clostridium aestuarii]MCY6484332.1 hypothetical protein [Clostridium aestuarii]